MQHDSGMNPKIFHFQLSGWRGIPAVLAVGVIAALVIGVVALVLFVGMAVVVAGIALSACAALYYAVRRKLAGGSLKPDLRFDAPPVHRSSEVREIEVEVLTDKER